MTKSTKRCIFSHNWHEFMYKKVIKKSETVHNYDRKYIIMYGLVINLDVWEENKYSMDNV